MTPLDEAVEPDVEIGAREQIEELSDAIASGPNWKRSERAFLLDIPSIGRFLLEDGRRIGFVRAADATDQDVAIFLAGSVFGILLHQRRHVVLHASAVVVNGRAVLFCGVSGAGKSTIAAGLGARGFSLMTDDQAAITLDAGGAPIVHPDGRMLRLWSHSIDGLALESRKGDAMRDRLEKFYVDPGDASSAALPVGAIYILAEERAGRSPGIKRPNLVDRSTLLLANAYRPALVRRMGQRMDYFHAAAALADTAGVFILTRQKDFAAMDETIARLEEHWSEIGLSAAPVPLPERCG